MQSMLIASLAAWTFAGSLAVLDIWLALRFPALPAQDHAPQLRLSVRLNWRFVGMLVAAAPLFFLATLADWRAGSIAWLLGVSAICLAEVGRLARKEDDVPGVINSIKAVQLTSFVLIWVTALEHAAEEAGFGARALKLSVAVLALGFSGHVALLARKPLKPTIVIGLFGIGLAAAGVHHVTTSAPSTPIDFTLPAAILLHFAAWLFVECRAQPPRYLRSQVRL